jgi:hypothetical protein
MVTVIGCASNAVRLPEQSLEHLQCSNNEFRGFGVGNSKNEALNAAYSDLAKQISSSIKVTETLNRSQIVRNDVENLSSEYFSKIVIKANLSNVQDAKVLRTEQRANGNTETVVCMSRLNAAKEFFERGRLIADSLDLLSNVALNTEHPKRKNDAWRKSQMLWNESLKIKNLLESWGVLFNPANETYSKIRDDYKSYCQSQKVYWEGNLEDQCSRVGFSELSKKIKIEKSECSKGLKLKFSCSEKCRSSSYGIECSFEPSLAIESCNAESYSLLRAKEPATGSDMHNKNRAMEKLVENLPRAAFFNEWEKEIKEWVPQCAE